jgi:long-chain acyl-CoA synthetase
MLLWKLSRIVVSVIDKILEHGVNQADKVAVYDGDLGISYLEFVDQIKAVALNLRYETIRSGDVLLLASSNSYSFICLYFAAHLLEAIVVIFPEDGSKIDKENIINKVSPKLCIDNTCSYLNNFTQKNFDVSHNFLSPDDRAIADLLFTSGTTGEAKGVQLRHSHLEEAAKHIISHVRNKSSDVELLLMPLSHSFGMARMRCTFYAGGSLVLGYSLKRLKSVFRAMDSFNVTGLGLVPAAWKFIIQISGDRIKQFSSQLNYIELGSAYFSAQEKQQMVSWFPDTHLAMHYGSTEVSRALYTYFHVDDPGAVGNLERGAEVKILDDQNRTLANNEVGEIVLKAPWMAEEYYLDEKLTKEGFVGGFFKTGDLGYLDESYLYLTGRIKEVINVGGKKVSPYSIESFFLQNKHVLECACVSLPDKNVGETVQVFIVANPENILSNEQIIEEMQVLAAKTFPVHMRPTKYTYVNQLPKTMTGKIKRLELSMIGDE